MDDTNEIIGSKLNNEGLENVTVYFTESTELSTTESVARQLPESLVENVNTEEEIAFDGLNSTSDYSKYYILEQEKETISKNVKVWVKTKKGI